MSTGVFLGLSLGQNRKPPALAVVEVEMRRRDDNSGYWDQHFTVRHLQQFEAKSTYPAIGKRLREISDGLVERNSNWRQNTHVDTTGLGNPVFELLKEYATQPYYWQVTFNHGDQLVEGDRELRVGKAYLVTRLQMLLQTNRLHLGRHPQSERLVQELLDYQLDTIDNANDIYGAFQVGTQDQLVTCLGLAVIQDACMEIPMPPEKPRKQWPPRREPVRLRDLYARRLSYWD